MNRAFYIVGIVFSVIFFFVSAYYVAECQKAYIESMYSDLYGDLYSHSSYSFFSSRADLTMDAGFWSLFFLASFLTIDLLGLIKVKTTTVKVLGIIGLSLTGIFLLWTFVILSSPSSISFDEVGPAWVLYCLVMLAFTIVGLVQSVRYANRLKNGLNPVTSKGKDDLLDS